jgi:hypothetical protein
MESGHCFIVGHVIPHYTFHILYFNKNFPIQWDVVELSGLYHLSYWNKRRQLT